MVADLAQPGRRRSRPLTSGRGSVLGTELDRLKASDSRWHYVSSIAATAQGFVIDHLVIGPGGVFSIHTTRHRKARVRVSGDAVTVNGVRRPYVRHSRLQAQRASDLLSSATRIRIRVRGVVVPVGAADFSVKRQPQNVDVVDPQTLVDFLRSQPPYLDGDTIARIVGYARLSSTWPSAAHREVR